MKKYTMELLAILSIIILLISSFISFILFGILGIVFIILFVTSILLQSQTHETIEEIIAESKQDEVIQALNEIKETGTTNSDATKPEILSPKHKRKYTKRKKIIINLNNIEYELKEDESGITIDLNNIQVVKDEKEVQNM